MADKINRAEYMAFLEEKLLEATSKDLKYPIKTKLHGLSSKHIQVLKWSSQSLDQNY